MDFSSRWFIKNGTNEGDLKDLKCRSIVPVELNAILFWNARIISEFHLLSGNAKKSAEFEQLAQEMYDVSSCSSFFLFIFIAHDPPNFLYSSLKINFISFLGH